MENLKQVQLELITPKKGVREHSQSSGRSFGDSDEEEKGSRLLSLDGQQSKTSQLQMKL